MVCQRQNFLSKISALALLLTEGPPFSLHCSWYPPHRVYFYVTRHSNESMGDKMAIFLGNSKTLNIKRYRIIFITINSEVSQWNVNLLPGRDRWNLYRKIFSLQWDYRWTFHGNVLRNPGATNANSKHRIDILIKAKHRKIDWSFLWMTFGL
jgi:hypothetical protein